MPVRVALDAMGSDNAPAVEVEGAVKASLSSEQTEVILVGDRALIESRLAAFPKHGNIRIVHASEAITMSDKPVEAVRTKKDASLLVAMRMVKNGEADAVVSAGNTGAVMVAARTILGPVRGVSRSAICQAIPTLKGFVVILDLGANVDCTARHLCEFAEMGVAYSHYALGIENPRLGLLNIGEEDAKGTSVARTVHQHLRAETHINFIGNIEPKAIFNGDADVVVCDGFVGNIILKTSEAVAGVIGKKLRAKLEGSSASKIGAMLASKALAELKKEVDPNESHGAPLLGVNGTVIILHGASTVRGIENGIHGGRINFEHGLNEHIRENIQGLRSVEAGMANGGGPPIEDGAPGETAVEAE